MAREGGQTGKLYRQVKEIPKLLRKNELKICKQLQ